MKRPFPVLVFLLRIGIALIFVVSGIAKLLDLSSFLDDVQAFRIVDYPTSFAVVMILPWLEVICGLGILSWRFSAACSFILSAVTLCFIYFVLMAHVSGMKLDCGCFGDWDVFRNFGQHMVFLVLLLASLVTVFVRTFRASRFRDQVEAA